MPIISTGDLKRFRGKFVMFMIYLLLIVGGASMVYPFMVTLTGTACNYFDYERRSALPRFIINRPDRMLRTLCMYFPPLQRNAMKRMKSFFPTAPDDWRDWKYIGSEEADAAEAWARVVLADIDSPEKVRACENQAADYARFVKGWELREGELSYDQRFVAAYLRKAYNDDITAFNDAWEVAIEDFPDIGNPGEWARDPIDQQSYQFRENSARSRDLRGFRKAYLENRYSGYLKSYPDAVSFFRPACLAYVWEQYAGKQLGISDRVELHKLPFPVPADAPEDVRAAWSGFLVDRFPTRHVEIDVNPERQKGFEKFVADRFKAIKYLNNVIVEYDQLDGRNTKSVTYSDWSELKLTPTTPGKLLGQVWMDYVKTRVPTDEWRIRDTLAEKAYQKYALELHGSLEEINAAYGMNLDRIECLRVPFRGAFLATFNRLDWTFARVQVGSNYATVFDYLFLRGRAVFNTIVLIILAVGINLTVNPLAGYALSRFRMRHTQQILIFCLATMAFPAAVTAIPGFLLLRDLGLLNTFAALVLPGAANGMSIFILKGFFDSLPKELYEAATIDGANEMQIFYRVSLPLVKPILAVNSLKAFIMAYNGWAWAILVCQDKSMWTLAVWTYQFSQIFKSTPFVVMAAYAISSIPVLLVFLFCQKIILRGIILPTMK